MDKKDMKAFQHFLKSIMSIWYGNSFSSHTEKYKTVFKMYLTSVIQTFFKWRG
jgi:hypothetical protein